VDKQAERKMRRAHYEKYRDLAKELHVTLTKTHDFMGIKNEPCESGDCGKCWTCLYREDRHLNNVPLRRWDAQAFALFGFNRRARELGLSLSEGVCLYKHLVTYEIVGAEPPKEVK